MLETSASTAYLRVNPSEVNRPRGLLGCASRRCALSRRWKNENEKGGLRPNIPEPYLSISALVVGPLGPTSEKRRHTRESVTPELCTATRRGATSPSNNSPSSSSSNYRSSSSGEARERELGLETFRQAMEVRRALGNKPGISSPSNSRNSSSSGRLRRCNNSSLGTLRVADLTPDFRRERATSLH